MKMVRFIGLACVLMVAACGSEENVAVQDQGVLIPEFGIYLLDPHGYTTPEFVTEVIAQTRDIAPTDADRERFDRLDGFVMHVIADEDWPFETNIGRVMGSEIFLRAISCAKVGQGRVQSLGGTLAHEIGHAIGHVGHDYEPWFGKNRHGPIEQAMSLMTCRDSY